MFPKLPLYHFIYISPPGFVAFCLYITMNSIFYERNISLDNIEMPETTSVTNINQQTIEDIDLHIDDNLFFDEILLNSISKRISVIFLYLKFLNS